MNTTTTTGVVITLAGKTIADVIAQAERLVTETKTYTAQALTITGTPATTKTTTKKTAPVVEPEVETETSAFDSMEETETEEETPFGTEEETPAKTAKAKTKAKKYTEKDVNAACLAHAKATGDRKKTLAILTKKFGVKSVLELNADQYEDVIKALTLK